ncbi:Equilibrative nucleotide transporter 1, partial [Bienertia sinuspersici]
MSQLHFVTLHKKIKIEHTLNQAKFAPNTSLWTVVQKIKWYGLGLTPKLIVTLSIFPGFVTEDVHSKTLGSWYPILLITCYNMFNFLGRSLTTFFLLDNANIALGCCCDLDIVVGANCQVLYKLTNDFGSENGTKAAFRNSWDFDGDILNSWLGYWL